MHHLPAVAHSCILTLHVHDCSPVFQSHERLREIRDAEMFLASFSLTRLVGRDRDADDPEQQPIVG